MQKTHAHHRAQSTAISANPRGVNIAGSPMHALSVRRMPGYWKRRDDAGKARAIEGAINGILAELRASNERADAMTKAVLA